MTIQTINPSASNHDARQAAGPVTLTGAVTIVGASQWGGLFLSGVAATAANLNAATLYYQATSTSHDDPAIYWYAQAADNAAVFTTTDNDIVNRSRTSNYVNDSASNIGTGTYRSVTITSLIAEVVGRAGWVPGNNIALIADGQTGADLWLAAWDSGAGVWYVEIDYTANANVNESIALGRGHTTTPSAVAGALGSVALGRGESAAPGGPAATVGALALGRGDAAALAGVLAAADSIIAAVGRGLTLVDGQPDGSATIEVNAGNDDGLETTGGSMVLHTAAIDTDSVGDIAGLLFRGLNAPNGAGIASAYIEVYPNDTGRQSPNVTIKGQANPANFTTTANDFSGRTMTTANVSWVATNIGTGAYKASPSLVSLLQEIVNGGDWTAGGNVAIFLIQNGASGWFRFASWNHTTDPAPRLIATWTSGAQAVTESLSLARGGGMELLPAADILAAIALSRESGVEPSPSASVLAAIALARGETATGDGAAGLAAALALARQLDAGAAALQGAAGSLALGRGLTASGDAAAGIGAAVALARQLGLAPAATQAALGALALGRGLGVEPSPAAGVLVVMELARAHGVTAADGFTILEAVALGRALGVTTANRVDAAAAVTIALARAIAGDGRAAGAGSVALGLGRTVAFQPVTAGREAVALARALGIAAAPGLALWEAVALSAGRGIGAAAALGYLETVALARRAGVTTAETLAAQEALLLALGNAAAVTAALGAAEAIALERVVGGAWGDVAGLFEAIGIGIYRAVAVNGAEQIVLITPRHLLIVDAEDRVTVIELENRVYRVQGESNERD